MVPKFRKQSKKAWEYLWKLGRLLGFVAKLEEEGKNNYVGMGEITGRTKNGKEYVGTYGFRMKVGLPVRGQDKKLL